MDKILQNRFHVFNFTDSLGLFRYRAGDRRDTDPDPPGNGVSIRRSGCLTHSGAPIPDRSRCLHAAGSATHGGA